MHGNCTYLYTNEAFQKTQTQKYDYAEEYFKPLIFQKLMDHFDETTPLNYMGAYRLGDILHVQEQLFTVEGFNEEEWKIIDNL